MKREARKDRPAKALLEACIQATPGEPRRLARALRVLVEALDEFGPGDQAYRWARQNLVAAAKEAKPK